MDRELMDVVIKKIVNHPDVKAAIEKEAGTFAATLSEKVRDELKRFDASDIIQEALYDSDAFHKAIDKGIKKMLSKL